MLTKEKIFNLLFIVILGASFYGVFWYTEERLKIAELINNSNLELVKQSQLKNENEIKELNNNLLGAKNNLTEVLLAEQSRNNSLSTEFQKILSTVTDLAKLSSTDKELLKKYSKVYFLNEHYVPISLTNIAPEYLSDTSKNFQIHSNVYPYLQGLIVSSNADGLGLRVQSAFRSFATQSILKSNYTFIYGEGTANRFSADQGYSEHQLGTTVDFTTINTSGVLNGFDKTKEYEWLLANAHRFGFVLSYPPQNKYYKFEPWHWRFVGIELATRLYNEKKYFYDMDQRVIDTYLISIFN